MAPPAPQCAHNTWTTKVLERWLCKDKDPAALGPHLFLGLLPLSWEGLSNMTSYRSALVSSSRSFLFTAVLPFRSWTNWTVVEQLLSLPSGVIAVQYCSVFSISVLQSNSLIKTGSKSWQYKLLKNLEQTLILWRDSSYSFHIITLNLWLIFFHGIWLLCALLLVLESQKSRWVQVNARLLS